MENETYLSTYEETLKQALSAFLSARGELDEMLPDAPDIEAEWEPIGQAYLTDGVREFNDFPTVSLGWMMFVGMAVAKFWDEDWAQYSQVPDLYKMLRDARGYDCMDEHICEQVLGLTTQEAQATSRLVADAAQIAHRALLHEGFEPGTPTAFYAYVRTLRLLYLLGAAVQLKRMGYRMEKI